MVIRVVPPTIRSLTAVVAAVVGIVLGSLLLTRAETSPVSPTAVPGGLGDGTTLLANGWRIAPTGRHLPLGTLPLNIALAPDGRYAIVTNNGLAKPGLTMIDLNNWSVKGTTQLEAAWYGMAWSPDGKNLYVGGAAQNNVQEFSYANGVLTRARTFTLPQNGEAFAGGLAISPNGRTLYVTRVFAMTLSAIDLTSGQVGQAVQLSAEPYTCVVSPDGRYVYVSIWGGAQVQVYSSDLLTRVATLPTGEHPNALQLSNDGNRLFVACGSDSSVYVFDTFSRAALEQVSTSPYADAPPTSTPNSLGLSPDGRTLLVANGDNNAVAVIDVSNPARSFVDGFIPAGWYPTGAVFTRDGKQILILNGKGLVPAANPLNAGLDRRLVGDLEQVQTPDRTTLNEYTRKVLAVMPYSDATKLAPANAPISSPIPQVVGGSSPIKHVFYVIRENRTYDQILGDLSQGNGDPKLAIFGRDTTPNAHALSLNFVLFDNFYADAEVSYDGHAFSTAAYATDFVQKMWQTVYANRGGLYLGEGGAPFRNPFGNLAAAQGGFIWDTARRAGVGARSYGEFVAHTTKPGGEIVAVETVPGLKGIVAPSYPGWELEIPDGKRVDAWQTEFRAYEKDGTLPALSIIRLPNDHTSGARPGAPTPRAMIAENDVALGRLVEMISSSQVYWKDSAIFVVEDDAQSGPDHVDAHRTILLVVSPFARRNAVDHTFYTTSSVLRTIELILGLPPMSQYDAAATPLYNAFSGTPNLGGYQRSTPGVPLDEKNLPSAFGATASLQMDFSVEDRAPELLLNEIIWRSVKGAHSPMPPPRRSVFIRPSSNNVDVDDDQEQSE